MVNLIKQDKLHLQITTIFYIGHHSQMDKLSQIHYKIHSTQQMLLQVFNAMMLLYFNKLPSLIVFIPMLHHKSTLFLSSILEDKAPYKIFTTVQLSHLRIQQFEETQYYLQLKQASKLCSDGFQQVQVVQIVTLMLLAINLMVLSLLL